MIFKDISFLKKKKTMSTIIKNMSLDLNIETLKLNSDFEKFCNFIKKHYTDDNFYSHQTVFQPYGTYRFGRENLTKFWDLYCEIYTKGVLNIAEKPQKHIPIYLDFDLKINSDNCNDDTYNDKNILDIINIIQEVVKECVDNIEKENLYVLCLEKNKVYDNEKKYIKHGIHFHLPYTFLKFYDVQIHIYPRILHLLKERKVFNNINLCEPIEKVFDINVLQNSWLMYNSSKNSDKQSYTIKRCFDENSNLISIENTLCGYKIYDEEETEILIDKENLTYNLPRIMSIIPYHRPIMSLKNALIFPQTILETKLKTKSETKQKKEYNLDVDKEREKLKLFLPIIKPDNYKDWILVLGVFKYLYEDDDELGWQLFDEWSQSEGNYDNANNYDIWKKHKQNFNMGVIINLCKKYNQSEYQKVLKDYKKSMFTLDDNFYLLFQSSTSAKDVSDYLYIIVKDYMFYTESHRWIVFNETTNLFDYNFNDEFIVSMLSNILLPKCHDVTENYTLRHKNAVALIEKQIEETQDKAELNSLKKKLKAHDKNWTGALKFYHKFTRDCGTFSFVNSIVKFLKHSCFQNQKFVYQFENKPYLFAFNDGTCINLDTNERRPINKNDKLFYAVSYDFPERNESDIRLVKDLLLDIFNTEDVVQDYLNATCLSLCGKNKNEIAFFHLGEGRNAKSLLNDILDLTLDIYAGTLSTSILCKTKTEYNAGELSELFKIEHKRYISVSEPNENETFKNDGFKNMTGNDIIKCKSMGKDKVEFVPKFTLHCLLNSMLKFAKREVAIDKRVKIIKYENTYTDLPDPENPFEKQVNINLKGEIYSNPSYRNGLLHLLIDKYLETKGKFIESNKIKQNNIEYFKIQNPLIEWVNNNFDITIERLDNNISFIELWEQFKSSHIFKTSNIKTEQKFGNFMKELCGNYRKVMENGQKFSLYYLVKKGQYLQGEILNND